jgi:hypothetical protein
MPKATRIARRRGFDNFRIALILAAPANRASAATRLAGMRAAGDTRIPRARTSPSRSKALTSEELLTLTGPVRKRSSVEWR